MKSAERFLVAIASVGVLAIFMTAAVYVYFVAIPGRISNNPSDWGVFGDYFGGTLSALFGFLSLLALLGTILIQVRALDVSQKALKTSESELKASRMQLELSTKAQQETAESLKEQVRLAGLSARISASRMSLDDTTRSLSGYEGKAMNAQELGHYHALIARKKDLEIELSSLLNEANVQ